MPTCELYLDKVENTRHTNAHPTLEAWLKHVSGLSTLYTSPAARYSMLQLLSLLPQDRMLWDSLSCPCRSGLCKLTQPGPAGPPKTRTPFQFVFNDSLCQVKWGCVVKLQNLRTPFEGADECLKIFRQTHKLAFPTRYDG